MSKFMIKTKKMTLTLVALLALLTPSLALASQVPAYAESASKNAACEGIGLTGGNCGGDAAETKVNSVFKTIVNVFSIIVGLVAVIMIIVAGFRYITSGGESSSVSGAKNALIYAIVGLIIVALAQFIVRFVIGVVA